MNHGRFLIKHERFLIEGFSRVYPGAAPTAGAAGVAAAADEAAERPTGAAAG
jgi:hypothetical protein